MFMVLLVLHDPTLLKDVLDSWEKSGAQGITILPSTGLARLKKENVLREDLPLIPSLEDLIQQEESLNRTLFTIVRDEGMVDRLVEATQKITGDLNLPNTGILAVLPIAKVYGLNRKTSSNEDFNN